MHGIPKIPPRRKRHTCQDAVAPPKAPPLYAGKQDKGSSGDQGGGALLACKSRVTRRWAQKHPGTKSGKQEETPSPKEAGSVCVCGRSSSFVEPGWDECTSAQVWPRHQAVAPFSELVVKGARSA